jgi:hypothetical protein
MCVLAARSAAPSERTRAVARVGRAATSVEPGFAAGWDESRASEAHLGRLLNL